MLNTCVSTRHAQPMSASAKARDVELTRQLGNSTLLTLALLLTMAIAIFGLCLRKDWAAVAASLTKWSSVRMLPYAKNSSPTFEEGSGIDEVDDYSAFTHRFTGSDSPAPSFLCAPETDHPGAAHERVCSPLACAPRGPWPAGCDACEPFGRCGERSCREGLGEVEKKER